MSPIKVVIFECDKCHKQNVLVAYHHAFGWYCRDCLANIRDRLNETIQAIDDKAIEINNNLGIDPTQPNN